MSALAANPRARWATPSTVSAFDTFTCGSESPYAKEVDHYIRKMHAGLFGSIRLRVAEDALTGDVLGFCYPRDRPLPPTAHSPGVRDAAYIALIGVSGSYRGYRLPDGVTRIGDFLLQDALREFYNASSNKMPTAWAMIAPENDASQHLFIRNDFENTGDGGNGYDYWVRANHHGSPDQRVPTGPCRA